MLVSLDKERKAVDKEAMEVESVQVADEMKLIACLVDEKPDKAKEFQSLEVQLM